MADFYNQLNKTKGSCLVILIFMNSGFILAVNLLFRIPLLKPFFENKLYFIFFGIVVYSLWLIILFKFFKKHRISFENLTLTSSLFRQAFSGAGLLFVLVNMLFLFFAYNIGNGFSVSPKFAGLSAILQSFGIFLFNILPGAFIEEITFRAFLLPQLYLVINFRVKNSSASIILAVLATTFIFGISHIPRDLLRFDLNIINFWNSSAWLFINGLIYSVIFLLTRSLWFTVFCHAFYNFSLVVITSESSSGFFFLLFGMIIALLWSRVFPVKPIDEKGALP